MTEQAAPIVTWPEWPPSAPRAKGLRVLLTMLIVLGPVVVVVALCIAWATSIDPSAYPTAAAYEAAVDSRLDSSTGASMILWLVGYALLAPKVSYRWFDTFALLVPLYGWVWQWRIAYRLANLPHRDWQPRPDEVAAPRAHIVPGMATW